MVHKKKWENLTKINITSNNNSHREKKTYSEQTYNIIVLTLSTSYDLILRFIILRIPMITTIFNTNSLLLKYFWNIMSLFKISDFIIFTSLLLFFFYSLLARYLLLKLFLFENSPIHGNYSFASPTVKWTLSR